MAACHVNIEHWNRCASSSNLLKKERTIPNAITYVCVFLLALLMTAPLYAQKRTPSKRTRSSKTPRVSVQAPSQGPQIVSCPPPGQALINMPEISSHNGVLRARIKLVDGLRTMWGSVAVGPGTQTDTRCATQYMRFFEGSDPMRPQPWPAGPDPIPGPTLRARVGDLIEITFQNQINPQHFANTLDQGELGKTPGCDEVFVSTPYSDWSPNTAYAAGAMIMPSKNNPGKFMFRARQAGTSGASEPTFPQVQRQTVTDNTVVWANGGIGPGQPRQRYPRGGDKMPNCLHGSSTANIHFHGTHTTPSTTGDNVLLYVHPSLRQGNRIEPSDAFVNQQFAQIFSACEKNGSPTRWQQIPAAWRKSQQDLLQLYDKTAPYKGKPGTLPPSMQLWPSNQKEIAEGLWPQYQMGAYPYCFRLAVRDPKLPPDAPSQFWMGQSPGTHWYHAHKHGSTALNVANGMTGIFIIEGQYDDDLHKFYGTRLREQVLMMQQLSTAPFPLLSPTLSVAPGAARAPMSVNGRRNPVVTMQPGEVQLWRVVNGDFRDSVKFLSFKPQGSQQPCNQRGPEAIVVPCIDWRQIAQDGVQFTFSNYNRIGKQDNQFNLAPANRADLLVKAPTTPGIYELRALANEGLPIQEGNPPTTYTFTLLTVQVKGEPVTPAMDFIRNESDFPKFPGFLADIPESSIYTRRKLVFGAGNTTIDGQAFNPNHVNQAMLLNTAEEWTVMNQANDKAHPFHIHINPFQVTEVFEPNSKAATTKGNPCYVDPDDPSTFKPCPADQPRPPYVWWDTFAIPTGQQISLSCTTLNACPEKLRPYTQCANGACTEFIPGWFKMRSRFVDYTGQYVLHCHILIHEDRGMMQLIEVVPDTTLYTHH